MNIDDNEYLEENDPNLPHLHHSNIPILKEFSKQLRDTGRYVDNMVKQSLKELHEEERLKNENKSTEE